MRLHRYIKEDMVDLAFEPLVEPAPVWDEYSGEGAPVEVEEGPEEEPEEGPPSPRKVQAIKQRILEALVGLLDHSGKVSNPRKLLNDLRNREAKATTGLGRGIAMPHVRTSQAKGFAMAVAVAPEPGLEFAAVDEEPVRLFVAMVAPAHDDKFYLRVERALAGAFERDDELRDALLTASSPGEVLRLLSDLID